MFKTGDHVVIECDDRIVDGIVLLASPNGISLMLEFEAILHGHAGQMPVVKMSATQGRDDYYETLFGDPVTLRRRSTH